MSEAIADWGEHSCKPPAITPSGGSAISRPDWTCGICGRTWRMWNGGGAGAVFWWAEVSGPTMAVTDCTCTAVPGGIELSEDCPNHVLPFKRSTERKGADSDG